MRLKIDYKKITDAPYKKDTEGFFSFTQIEVEALVNLVSKMNESSYYLSGYRGVGKTSFIRKVEEELTKINGYIFIHVPISKYDKYEILIRSFIRQFYIQFVESGDYKKFEKEDINGDLKKLVLNLGNLNKQTFAEVQKEKTTTVRSETIKVKNIEIDIKELLLSSLPLILTILSFTIDFTSEIRYKLVLQIFSLLWTTLQFIKLGYSISKTNSDIHENSESEKSLYDDEIAEYRFNSLLKDFKKLGSPIIKPVFIIDELDKLLIEDAKKVLFLFKSTLLSGNANFIVVGGQELYYELYTVNQTEDPILSTLFSKTLHVPLKSSFELRNLLEKLILNIEVIQTKDQNIAYEQYINRLVIASKKIPRKFVNLIKNELSFEGDTAYIDISEEYNRPWHTELLSAIDRVSDSIASHPEPIKDYLVMNLFEETSKLFRINSRAELNTYIKNLK